jgi:hypothetical protein
LPGHDLLQLAQAAAQSAHRVLPASLLFKLLLQAAHRLGQRARIDLSLSLVKVLTDTKPAAVTMAAVRSFTEAPVFQAPCG